MTPTSARLVSLRTRIGGLVALCVLSWPVPLVAQPAFPSQGVLIIDAFLATPDGLALAQGSDDDRRALTKKIIEQLICAFPNDEYVWKSASKTRPPSKDSVARRQGDRLWSWDWQNGSTRKRHVQAGQAPSFDISDQHAIPLACVDHLGDVRVPPPLPPVPPAPVPSVDLTPIQTQLTLQQAAVMARLSALEAQLTRHDEEPAWALKVLGNRYVQAALAAIAGWAATR